MTWKNEFANAKKVFKHGTWKQKIEYIFDYYKWHIIAILSILLIIGSIIYTNNTEKNSVLNGMFLNTFAEAEVILELQNDFTTQFPINSSSEEIIFDSVFFYPSNETDHIDLASSYETTQLLVSKIAAGNIDFVVAETSVLNEFIYGEYCYALSEILSEEQIDTFSPYFLYCDKALLEQIANMDFTTEKLSDIDFPDPSKSGAMETPIPVMIDISDSPKVHMLYPNSTSTYALAFIINGHNSQKALDFLEYLMQ